MHPSCYLYGINSGYLMRGAIADRKNQLLLCVVLTIVTFMASFDQSVVSSVIPEIAIYYGIDVGVASWVEIIYQIFMAGLIPIFGKICDRGAMKKVLFCGVSAFICGSIISLLTDSFTFLLVSRMIMGIGASTIWCSCVMIGVKSLPKELVSWVMVSITAGGTLGSLAGPLVGAVIITFFDLKLLYLIDILFGATSLYLIWRAIPKDEFLGLSDFDMKGAIMLVFAMFFGSYGLEVLVDDGLTILTAALASAFLFSLYMFIRSNRRAADPIIDPTIFNDRNTNRLTLLYVIELLTINGLLFLVPIYSFVYMGHSSVEKGVLIFIPAMVACVTSFIIGKAIVKKRKKPFMYLTCFSLAISTVSLMLIDLGPMLMIMVTSLLSGLLWALGEIAIASTIVNSAPNEKRGTSSVINSYIGNLTEAVAVAIFSKMFVIGSRSEGMVITDIPYEAFMGGLFLITTFCMVLAVLAFVLIFRYKEYSGMYYDDILDG